MIQQTAINLIMLALDVKKKANGECKSKFKIEEVKRVKTKRTIGREKKLEKEKISVCMTSASSLFKLLIGRILYE